jgi:hypothetical protein
MGSGTCGRRVQVSLVSLDVVEVKTPDERELSKKGQFGLCFGYRVERLWTFTAVMGRGRWDENSNVNQYSITPALPFDGVSPAGFPS